MATAAELEKNERVYTEVTALRERTGDGIMKAFETYSKESGMHPATAAKHYYAHNKIVKANGNGSTNGTVAAAAKVETPKVEAPKPEAPKKSGVKVVADEKKAPRAASVSTQAHRPASATPAPEVIPIPDAPAKLGIGSTLTMPYSAQLMELAGHIEMLEQRLAKFEALAAFLRE